MFAHAFRALAPRLLTLGLLAALPGKASDSLRCANRLVSRGASQPEVVARCGPPTSVKQRHLTRRIRVTEDVEEYEDLEWELWLYDFGPHNFIQQLTFENGFLIDVQSGNYGTPAGQPPPEHPRE